MSQVRNQVLISLKTMTETMPAYRIVAPATGAANTCMVHNTTLCAIIGVSTSEHSVTGAAVSVAIGGTAKIMCGENISTGSMVIPQSVTGMAMQGARSYSPTTGSIRTVGISLEVGSVGALMEVLINPQNLVMKAT